jgi:hypothetical protein
MLKLKLIIINMLINWKFKLLIIKNIFKNWLVKLNKINKENNNKNYNNKNNKKFIKNL